MANLPEQFLQDPAKRDPPEIFGKRLERNFENLDKRETRSEKRLDTDEARGTWTTWTPTLTALTLGNGTKTGRYAQIGKVVHYRFSFVLGSTSAVTGVPQFSLPVAPAAALNASAAEPIGQVVLVDSGTRFYGSTATLSATPTIVVRLTTSDALFTEIDKTDISALIPFIWTTGDQIIVTGTYEAA